MSSILTCTVSKLEKMDASGLSDACPLGPDPCRDPGLWRLLERDEPFPGITDNLHQNNLKYNRCIVLLVNMCKGIML